MEENSAAKHQDSTSDSPDHSQVTLALPYFHSFFIFKSPLLIFFCKVGSRKPNLSSLQIPARSSSLEAEFTRIEITQCPSPAKPGLPPRPNSAKFKSTVKNLPPQRSLKVKALSEDGEKTVLIVPDTPPSDSPAAKPSTSRSFSLNKVLFPLKPANSLPVTPCGNSDPEAVLERNINSYSDDVSIPGWLL